MMPLDPQHFVDCIALNVRNNMSDERFREFVEDTLELYWVSEVVAERLEAIGRPRESNHEGATHETKYNEGGS